MVAVQLVRETRGLSHELSREWPFLVCQVNYSALRADIDKFNAEHKWLKRGVAIVGAKGNMGFMESDDINRGIAVVEVREDGL